MSPTKPICVVIPVYNGENYVGEAIESVLQQTVKPRDIIVVDDGSTDNSKDTVAKFKDRITYLYQENRGPAKARNTGILASNREFISFLDADDVWHTRKLEKQFAEFDKFKNLQITLGLKQIQYSNPEGGVKKRDKNAIVFNLSFGSSLMKRSVFEEVGLLDEELIVGEDTDWFLRARERGVPISVHRDVVLYYRRHENNLTNTNRISKLSVLQVLKKAKDRKGNPGVAAKFAYGKPSDMDELIEMWNMYQKI